MGKKITSLILFLGITFFSLGGYIITQPGTIPFLTQLTQLTQQTSAPVSDTPAVLGAQTKTSNCVAQVPLPDLGCTPGAIFPDITKDQICISGYSHSVRNVPDSLKQEVFAEYGITSHTKGEYEVDHYISLELGGTNDISNLWPELAEPQPGFHQKDQVENYLHEQVCSGNMSLQEAQTEIRTNWLAVYHRIAG